MQDGSPAALLADMNTLPGLEGAPVVDEEGALVGVMGPCLTHTGFQAQVGCCWLNSILREGINTNGKVQRGQRLGIAIICS